MKLAKKILAMLIIMAFTITVAYLPLPATANAGSCSDRRDSCEAACNHANGCMGNCQDEYQQCCSAHGHC